MTRGDQLIERAASRLDDLAQRAASEGGLKAKLARPLAEDAGLLRDMRPSLIAARLRGETADATSTLERAEPVERTGRGRRSSRGGGVNPLALVAAAFFLGLVIARVIDWRSHAHPRG